MHTASGTTASSGSRLLTFSSKGTRKLFTLQEISAKGNNTIMFDTGVGD